MATPASTAAQPGKFLRGRHVAQLGLVLMLTLCFSLATNLSVWFQKWRGNRAGNGDYLAVALGDARRMFATHFFVKADAYFHSGFYPSIYDNLQAYQTPHIAADSGVVPGHNTGDEDSFLGPPRNWIDSFGRDFYPSIHTHLTSGGANGKEGKQAVGEILPWLKLSQELDPKRVETYSVTAYWLRSMGKLNEALNFLRQGLRQNPGNPQLLFDLGRLYFEYRHDPVRARFVWEAGLRNLAKLPPAKDEKTRGQRLYVKEQILGQMARLEEQQKNYGAAIQRLEQLKSVLTNPRDVQDWIDELKAKEKK